jgi:hypothetical protein
MKKIFFAMTILFFTNAVVAQEQEIKKRFKKENLFTGGNVQASFFNGTTVLGISPYFGYSLNRFVDLAISTNFNYVSQRDYQDVGDKLRQTVYGGGAFVRLFPVSFIFAQAQYEHNFIKYKYIPASNSGYLLSTLKDDANSLLVGGGYTNGREGIRSTYYYLSVLWDVSGNASSPYVDGLGRNFPLFRAGINIALFQ